MGFSFNELSKYLIRLISHERSPNHFDGEMILRMKNSDKEFVIVGADKVDIYNNYKDEKFILYIEEIHNYKNYKDGKF